MVPTESPVIVVLGNNEFVTTPIPETNVHPPVPTAGKFPFIVAVGDETHKV